MMLVFSFFSHFGDHSAFTASRVYASSSKNAVISCNINTTVAIPALILIVVGLIFLISTIAWLVFVLIKKKLNPKKPSDKTTEEQ